MDQLSTTLPEPEATPDVSTQLKDSRPADPGQAQHKLPAEEPKPTKETRLDAIKRAAADIEKAEPAKDEKPAEAKEKSQTENPVDPKGEAEPAKVDAKEPGGEEQAKLDEQKREPKARHIIDPPEKFLPRAKELWPNTPHEVRTELSRILSETEAQVEQARRETVEYEKVKPFAELARQSGTSLDVALDRYVRMEQTLRADPSQGFKALFQNMGIGPQQAIGHILAAYNVAPERLAAHIAADPNAYTALARSSAQPAQATQAQTTEVQQLREELNRVRQQIDQTNLHSSIVEPFMRDHPDFTRHEDAIAVILESGILERLYGKLSERDRLAAAYDMAVRNSPSHQAAPASVQQDEAVTLERRAGHDFGGSKSVRGAPASGVDASPRRKSKMSRMEAIQAASAELGLN